MEATSRTAAESRIAPAGAEAASAYARLMIRLAPLRADLLAHPLYQALRDAVALRAFMETHVFAVWDFMTLLKSLQRRVTSVSLPWLPPLDADAGRLINEIVLEEETDEVLPGQFTSHFELYVRAMNEVGADVLAMKRFVTVLRLGEPVDRAIRQAPIPEHTKRFVQTTMGIAVGRTHEVAASFLLGREDVIPAMFQRILQEVEGARGHRCECFRIYLERHMQVDEEHHAPRARRLLQRLCGADEAKWEQALQAAALSIRARLGLWDGALAAIKA